MLDAWLAAGTGHALVPAERAPERSDRGGVALQPPVLMVGSGVLSHVEPDEPEQAGGPDQREQAGDLRCLPRDLADGGLRDQDRPVGEPPHRPDRRPVVAGVGLPGEINVTGDADPGDIAAARPESAVPLTG